MSQWADWMRAMSWIVFRDAFDTLSGSSEPYGSPMRTLMHVMADSDTESTLYPPLFRKKHERRDQPSGVFEGQDGRESTDLERNNDFRVGQTVDHV